MAFAIFMIAVVVLVGLLLRFRKPPMIYSVTALSFVVAIAWNSYILRICSEDCAIRMDLIVFGPVLVSSTTLSGRFCTQLERTEIVLGRQHVAALVLV
jgi:hypothetical protein